MASFKTIQEYEEAKQEWMQVPHSAYIQSTGKCVQMIGTERLIFEDPLVSQIIGPTTYNAVGKIDNLNQRFRNSEIAHFKEFRHFKCILDIEEKAFENCAALEEIYLPEYVYTIGNHAFSHCTSLENIKLQGYVEVIGESGFSNCTQLCIIELPYSVLSIRDYAFYNCQSLEEIDMKPLYPPYIENETLFRGCECLRAINIWPAAIDRYCKHPVWSKFKSLFKVKEMR